MHRVYYNKLIRDNIPQKIKDKGERYDVRIIEDDEEYQQELLKKIKEEAIALAHTRSREDFLNEYTDLMVVLDTLTAHLEYSEADIRTAISENIEKKGGFKERYFLNWSADSEYKSNETPQGLK